ncbi:MAG: hypothetical protein ACR2RF_02275 [Geminicoccaceae bacterium]
MSAATSLELSFASSLSECKLWCEMGDTGAGQGGKSLLGAQLGLSGSAVSRSIVPKAA